VKFSGHLREVGLPRLQYFGDWAQERRNHRHTDEPIDEIAERQTVARRVVAVRAFQDRVDGAAEIGTKHKRQRSKRRDEMRKGQRHNQENAGNTGMHCPRNDRADDNAQGSIAGDGVHENAHARRVLRRCQRFQQDVQRQQH
jgi:hypothetical protein